MRVSNQTLIALEHTPPHLMNPDSITALTTAQTNNNYPEVHKILWKLSSEELDKLAEHHPEFVWEGLNADEQLKNRCANALHHKMNAVDGPHLKGREAAGNPPKATLCHLQRAAQNTALHAELKHIGQTIGTALTGQTVYLDVTNPFAMELLKSPNLKTMEDRWNTTQDLNKIGPPSFRIAKTIMLRVGHLPRWALALNEHPGTIAEHDISVFYDQRMLIRKATKGEAAASMAIFWPELATELSEGRPGIEELAKLRDWDPTTPCPLNETTLEELSRWKNRAVLAEWGVTRTLLTKAKHKKIQAGGSLWSQTGNKIHHKSQTFLVSKDVIINTQNTTLAYRVGTTSAMVVSRHRCTEEAKELKEVLERHKIKNLLSIECWRKPDTDNPAQGMGHEIGREITNGVTSSATQFQRIDNVLAQMDPSPLAIVLPLLIYPAKLCEIYEIIAVERNDKHTMEPKLLHFIRKWLQPAGYHFEQKTLANLI